MTNPSPHSLVFSAYTIDLNFIDYLKKCQNNTLHTVLELTHLNLAEIILTRSQQQSFS